MSQWIVVLFLGDRVRVTLVTAESRDRAVHGLSFKEGEGGEVVAVFRIDGRAVMVEPEDQ